MFREREFFLPLVACRVAQRQQAPAASVAVQLPTTVDHIFQFKDTSGGPKRQQK
jgi:hypothetical protein